MGGPPGSTLAHVPNPQPNVLWPTQHKSHEVSLEENEETKWVIQPQKKQLETQGNTQEFRNRTGSTSSFYSVFSDTSSPSLTPDDETECTFFAGPHWTVERPRLQRQVNHTEQRHDTDAIKQTKVARYLTHVLQNNKTDGCLENWDGIRRIDRPNNRPDCRKA